MTTKPQMCFYKRKVLITNWFVQKKLLISDQKEIISDHNATKGCFIHTKYKFVATKKNNLYPQILIYTDKKLICAHKY